MNLVKKFENIEREEISMGKMVVAAKVAHPSSPSRTKCIVFWDVDNEKFKMVNFKELDALCDTGDVVGINRKGVLHSRYTDTYVIGKDPEPAPNTYYVLVEIKIVGLLKKYRLVGLDGQSIYVSEAELVEKFNSGCVILGMSYTDNTLALNGAIPITYENIK